jgi:hypothetical protein
MTATASAPEDEHLEDPERLETELARHTMTTSSGTADLSQATWLILLTTDGNQIRRDVWRDRVAWEIAAEGWEPEGVIWPTWPVRAADEMSSAEAPLTGVQKYWNKSGNRLRDSAKWMATVLGAALATLAGTSPLTAALQHRTATEMVFPPARPTAAVRHAVPDRASHATADGVLHRSTVRERAARAFRLVAGQVAGNCRVARGPLPAVRSEVPDQPAPVHDHREDDSDGPGESERNQKAIRYAQGTRGSSGGTRRSSD